MEDLVAKAKAFDSRHKGRVEITDEIKNLVYAWLDGELSISQVGFALDKRNASSVGNIIFNTIKQLRNEGKIKIIG
jgi:hypothetical protein